MNFNSSFFLSSLTELYSFSGVNDNVIEIFLLRSKTAFATFHVIPVFTKNIWKTLSEKDNETACFSRDEIRVEMTWKLRKYLHFSCNITHIVSNSENMPHYKDKNTPGLILVVKKACDYLL